MTATQLLVRVLLLGGLVASAPALAQDAGADGGIEDLDASLPDASVGGGSADNTNPEQGDGQPVVFCKLNRDCDRGFNCVDGKCTWSGYKDATNGGCSGAPELAGLSLGALALRLRRKRS